MDEEYVKEAARVVSVGVGFSAYFTGIQYPLNKFKEELESAVKYIKANS